MKYIKIDIGKEYNDNNNNNYNNNKCFFTIKKKYINNVILFIFFINIIITIYLFKANQNQNGIIKQLLNFKNANLKNNYPNNDKEMIGLYHPNIDFDKIKEKLKNVNIVDSLLDLISQLEIKLIYLEKEIDLIKLISFYTSRKYYLKECNITYNEENITQLHEIINWIIIHQSNQLKGIASDKYLACKYVKFKLGINLCQQRIAVYSNISELNYKKLSKYGNIVLKVSNSCWKSVFINKNETFDSFNQKLEKFKKLYEFDHGVVNVQPFHLYAKKRIIVEKQFFPFTELYEFKITVLNRDIKYIALKYYLNRTKAIYLIYDSNYNFQLYNNRFNIEPPNLKAIFKKDILENLKTYTINLSEDFPNYIRVDLYIFHEKIYLSELTFASNDGLPFNKNAKKGP